MKTLNIRWHFAGEWLMSPVQLPREDHLLMVVGIISYKPSSTGDVMLTLLWIVFQDLVKKDLNILLMAEGKYNKNCDGHFSLSKEH